MVKIQCLNSNFEISIESEDFGEEIVGDCRWYFRVRDIAKACASYPCILENSSIGEALVEQEVVTCEWDESDIQLAEMLKPEMRRKTNLVAFHNTDDAILLGRTLAQLPGDYPIQWEGDNPCWLFHDLTHVEYDCKVYPSDHSLTVTDASEKHALIQGAKRAVEANEANASQVFEYVASVLPLFKERFGYKPDIVEQIFVPYHLTRSQIVL